MLKKILIGVGVLISLAIIYWGWYFYNMFSTIRGI